jgi:Ulp1 family protease
MERSRRSKSAEKLVYTPRNPDLTVELFMDNLKCLAPSTYLNDEVIQFYTAYLMADCCKEPGRLHVFDNYFHNILRDTFNNDSKGNDLDKWRQLNKWFNRINIFEKDFLIFPICLKEHWFAIVVCHPYEVKEFDVKSSGSRHVQRRPPGILMLDSLGGQDELLTREVRCFLDFEWRTRFTGTKDFFYHNLKQYHPKLPRQTNSYDCGIFMLAYLRAFIQKPDRFYRAARDGSGELQAELTEMINRSLTYCGREAIKNLINKECKRKICDQMNGPDQ